MLTLFTACKKEADLDPELSARVVGNYTLTGLKASGTLYTVNAKTTGKMSVVRETATSVSISADVTNSGSPSDDFHLKATNVSLADIGGGEVSLTKDGSTFAKGGNNTLSISVAPIDGSTPFQFIGTK